MFNQNPFPTKQLEIISLISNFEFNIEQLTNENLFDLVSTSQDFIELLQEKLSQEQSEVLIYYFNINIIDCLKDYKQLKINIKKFKEFTQMYLD